MILQPPQDYTQAYLARIAEDTDTPEHAPRDLAEILETLEGEDNDE